MTVTSNKADARAANTAPRQLPAAEPLLGAGEPQTQRIVREPIGAEPRPRVRPNALVSCAPEPSARKLLRPGGPETNTRSARHPRTIARPFLIYALPELKTFAPNSHGAALGAAPTAQSLRITAATVAGPLGTAGDGGRVSFLEWTPDGLLRHVVYLGERKDKPAAEVRRQRPQDE